MVQDDVDGVFDCVDSGYARSHKIQGLFMFSLYKFLLC